MNLKSYLAAHAQHWSKPELDPKGFVALEYATPIPATDYLAFAEKDLRSGGPRGLVNSLTNSKRAIDCEISNVLIAVGLKEPRNFSDRLDLIQSLGLLAPRIVRKMVQLRNVLEHKYYKPERAEVDDALDIAALFLEVMKPYRTGGAYMASAWLADSNTANKWPIQRTKTHTIWRHDQDPKYTYASGIYLDTELNSKKIDLMLVHKNIEIGSIEITPSHTGYIELQGLLLRSEIDNLSYKRSGAIRFLKVLSLVPL